MDGTIQNYTLDMAADTKKEPLRVKQYDTNSRQARITLKMGDEPWTIPFGCQIHINVRKTDGTLADATCTRIDEHTVLTPITEQMTAVMGTQLGELYFLGSDGDIKSQSFPVVVYEAVMDQARIESSDDFQSLQGALRQVQISTDMADAATQYATEQGNQARDAAQRAEDAAASIQVAVDAAAAAKVSETNAKTSETAAARTQQEVTDYVEAQKATFVGYSQRESDSKYANALTNSVTGEGGVTVEDAWTAPVLGLDVAGKSEQVVTTGANLFGGRALADKIAEVAVGTKIDTIQRTVTYYASNISKKEIFIDFSAGKEYTIILYGRNSDDGLSFCNMAVEYDDGTNGNLTFDSHGSDSYCIYHTIINKNTTKLFGYHNAGTTTLYYDKCGIFEGNIDLSAFEPYTGGAPSPSPDYPQDIISVGTVTTGAQLLDLREGKSGTKGGVTYTNRGDGTYKRNGTATESAGNAWFLGGFNVTPAEDNSNVILTLAPGKTYTITDCNLFTVEGGEAPTITGTVTIDAATYPNGFRATGVRNKLQTVGITYDDTIYPMVCAGDTSLPWEPYTGGKPSPTVENPQEVKVKATGAQLLDLPDTTGAYGGIKYTFKGGEITATGSPNTRYTVIYWSRLTLSPGNYYISGGDMSAGSMYAQVSVEKNGVIKTYVNRTFTVTGDESAISLTIQNGASTDPVSYSFKPMLNAGPTAIPWEPFRSASAVIPLTEPLRGIGEYRDRIRCKDDVWGIERSFIQLTFNGGEKWGIGSTSTTGKNRFVLSETVIKREQVASKPINIMCDRLKAGSSSNTYSCTERISSSVGGSISIYLEDLSSGDVDAFKAYLSTHPISAIFERATPTWEPLPAATQQALNELTTYAGTTHLTITAGGLIPDVTLEYVQDTQKAIEQHDAANRQYTDNQIAAIVAALPTATQAAIVDNQTTKLLQEVWDYE